MRTFKIGILGNSVALRVRPPLKIPENVNYGRILEKQLQDKLPDTNVIVTNKAKGAATIIDFVRDIDNQLNLFPDFFILNFGVVDSCTREVPKWFYDIQDKKTDNLFRLAVASIYSRVFKKNRPFFVRIRGQKSWVSYSKYEKYFKKALFILSKETNAEIIVLSINLANQRVEDELPGSRKNQIKFNNLIKKITTENGHLFLDTSSLQSENYYPDGVHFSNKGHKQIADLLTELILSHKQK